MVSCVLNAGDDEVAAERELGNHQDSGEPEEEAHHMPQSESPQSRPPVTL